MRRLFFVISAILLTVGPASFAEETRPYIGLSLDSTALPELLVKHLRLEPGQGIRISNVMLDSPANAAGLERDDIIAAFRGKPVTSVEQFVEAVRTAGVGEEVALEVIHLGQRKSMQVGLKPRREGTEWKYPPEPQAMTSWQPGKVFRIGPDGREWIEVPFDKMPEFDLDVGRFFREVRSFRHSTDGEEYTITIEGDPADEDSRVTVRAGDTEHKTTVGELDKLPEKYRGPAREDLENARRNANREGVMRRFRLPEPPRPDVQRFFQTIPRPDMERWSEQKDRALERLQEQMERLQQQMQDLEQRNRETLNKLLDKLETRKDDEAKPEESSAPPAPGQGRAI